ncbi:MAG: hypothetical protein AAFO91_15185, partial [Bacteroidota bacterium]
YTPFTKYSSSVLQHHADDLKPLFTECTMSHEPVYLQYSSNGGLYWHTMETFHFKLAPVMVREHVALCCST